MNMFIKDKLFFLILLLATNIYALESDLMLKLHSGTSTEIHAISNPQAGMIVFNTTEHKVYDYNGTAWIPFQDRMPVIISNDTNNQISVGSDGGAYYSVIPQVLKKTGNYTLAIGDNGAVITFDSATAVTLTIPAGLPEGYNVSIYQIGTGKITIAGNGGVVVKNRLSRFKTAGKDAGVGIVSTAINVYHVTGDLKK